ncbi:hypothetical protein Tco_0536875 [Tanacetum coccineum]
MLDKKELSLTLDDFRTIFHLPQATDNNHDSFVPPPSFLDMVPFYKNELGFTMEQKTSSSFKTTGLLQPWQTLCKIFFKCLTTRVTGWDQPLLQIMQMMRARDRYHNLKDDDIMKNIFNSGRYKDKVRMKITAWMISEEMKHTEHYWMYAEVFGIDVPLTYSEVEITNDEEVEITNVVIPVNVNEEEEEITEVYELNRREKGKIVEESRSIPFPIPIRSPRIHTDLVSSDTEKLQELTVTDTTPTPSSSSSNTKLSTTNRLLSLFKAKPTRTFLSRKSFELLADSSQEGLLLKRQQNKEEADKMIAKAMLQERGKLQDEISSQIQKAIDTNIPSLVDASVRSYMSGYILHVHPAQPQTTSVPEQQYQLYLSMKADPQLQQQDIAIWLAL